MKQRIVAAALVAFTLALSHPLSAQQMTFNRVGIRDPWVSNIEGATMLVPDGWKVDGGFLWMPLYSMQANLLVRVSEPNSGTSVDLLPAQQFNYPMRDMGGLTVQPGSNWNGSVLLAPPRDASEFVQQTYMNAQLSHLRNAKLVGGEDLPKLADAFVRANPGAAGAQVRVTRLRYNYEINGKAFEEDVYVTLTFAPSNGWNAMWWCNGYAMRASAGELDRARPTLDAIVHSVRLSLDWSATLEQCREMFRKGIRQEQIDQQKLSQMYQQYRDQMREQHQKVWEERQAQQDRQNFAFRELLGGVETYKDPYESRAIELPNGYKDYWVNNKGQYILSNDATYDPRQGTTVEWKRMERYQP